MAISLNSLKPAKGSTHKKKRVGRGPGSGLGKTAGRGEKGQKSRSGYSRKIGFEGGQMPLHRRLPKRGFTNIFKKQWVEISLAALDQHFEANEEITPEVLHVRGLIKKAKHDVVVLGNGEVVTADASHNSDLLAFLQRAEARAFHGADVHEHVRAALIRLDRACRRNRAAAGASPGCRCRRECRRTASPVQRAAS